MLGEKFILISPCLQYIICIIFIGATLKFNYSSISHRSQGGYLGQNTSLKFNTMHSVGQHAEGSGQVMHKKKKLGHRRVKVDGEVTYKKIVTTQLIGSIQLGVQHAVGSLANVPHRDLLMKDFMSVGKNLCWIC